MTLVDWILVAVVAFAALNGFRRGLVAGALSLAGLATGADFGAQLAPQVLDDTDSAYTPLVALGGALIVAFLFQAVGSIVGGFARGGLVAVPPLRGSTRPAASCSARPPGWRSCGSSAPCALHLPGQTELRREVQASTILRHLNRSSRRSG